VLDSLKEVQLWLKDLTNVLFDEERIGIGGHSYGAYISQLMGGARVVMPLSPSSSSYEEREESEGIQWTSFRDARIKATLLISPQGVSSNPEFRGLREKSWDEYEVPLMVRFLLSFFCLSFFFFCSNLFFG